MLRHTGKRLVQVAQVAQVASSGPGCDIILNLIQNAFDVPSITAIIQSERKLSNDAWTFVWLQVRQVIEIFSKWSRASLICVDESYLISCWHDKYTRQLCKKVLLNLPILGSNSRKGCFLCWIYWWCTLRSKFKQRTRFARTAIDELAISRFGFCQDRLFLEENFDTEWWMLSKTHH